GPPGAHLPGEGDGPRVIRTRQRPRRGGSIHDGRGLAPARRGRERGDERRKDHTSHGFLPLGRAPAGPGPPSPHHFSTGRARPHKSLLVNILRCVLGVVVSPRGDTGRCRGGTPRRPRRTT